MTFDELWRRSVAPERDAMNSGGETEDADMFDVSTLADARLDEPEEWEVNRYLEWLEKTLG